MKILVTGARGFVGRNLCAQLNCIKNHTDRRFPELEVEEVMEYDIDSSEEELVRMTAEADFVFNLAGVNRPEDPADFKKGNFGFASHLLHLLRSHGNRCPVMLSSSVQATLEGRFKGSPYGESKLAGEGLFFEYADQTGARVLVYRFPNLFGKWCRSNYNSAVATFCHNIARSLPITVNDRSTQLDLVYIDDLVDEMLLALQGREHRCRYEGAEEISDPEGEYCHVPTRHHASLGEIVDLLQRFHDQPSTLIIPEIPEGSLAKKLYSTYLSYLPEDRIAFPLKMNCDERGSFTELLRTLNCGQVSINISRPGITKGEHWHNTKWEFFIVVAGRGLIRQRRIGSGEIIEREVSGDRIEAVHMLPGYTHSIVNLSQDRDLVTVMYCNECFDPSHPDTFRAPVD